jgi:hypothetical protein
VKQPDTKPAQRAKPTSRLLQQTLSELQRSRTVEVAANHEPTTSQPDKELADRLRQLELEKKEAQELADTLLMQQQALMLEKQRFHKENMALQTEKQQLLERLTYLEDCNEDGSEELDSPGYYTGSDVTPEHKLRQLYLDVPEEGVDGLCLERLHLSEEIV